MSDGNGHNSRELYEQAFPLVPNDANRCDMTTERGRCVLPIGHDGDKHDMPTRTNYAQVTTGGSSSRDRRTTAQLSSAERSIVNDRIIAQVGELTKANNALNARIDAIEQRAAASETAHLQRIDAVERGNAYTDRRIDAIERGAAVLSAWLRRPLWERVRARFGF